MSESRRNSFYISDVNRESLAETMSVGIPWCFQTSFANTTTRSATVFFSLTSGMKCAIFVNLSITIHSWSQFSESGNSVMKSMANDCHGAYANSSGDDRLYR